MNRKLIGILIGAIVGAVLLGACSLFLGGSWRIVGLIVGLILGAIGGLMFTTAQAQMAKDRETGLDS